MAGFAVFPVPNTRQGDFQVFLLSLRRGRGRAGCWICCSIIIAATPPSPAGDWLNNSISFCCGYPSKPSRLNPLEHPWRTPQSRRGHQPSVRHPPRNVAPCRGLDSAPQPSTNPAQIGRALTPLLAARTVKKLLAPCLAKTSGYESAGPTSKKLFCKSVASCYPLALHSREGVVSGSQRHCRSTDRDGRSTGNHNRSMDNHTKRGLQKMNLLRGAENALPGVV